MNYIGPFDFIESIWKLMSHPENPPKNLEEFLKIIQRNELIDPKQLETINTLMDRLISRQFQDTPVEATREAIANMCDAHFRAEKKNDPVYIITDKEKHQLSFIDQGDGINLSNFLVPARSTTIRSLEEKKQEKTEVIGRFGLGSKSYHYFINNSLKSEKEQVFLSGFQTKNNHPTLHIFYKENGNYFEAIFSLSSDNSNEIDLQIHQHKRDPERKKITIHTCWDVPVKLRFYLGDAGKIVFDLVKKAKDTPGTVMKISSPLVEGSTAQRIEKKNQEIFLFVPNPPIIMNGIRINSNKGMKSLPFDGGILHYSPLEDAQTYNGSLWVCENGRRILPPFSKNHALVPTLVAISFDQLPLSLERGTMDFKEDQNTLSHLQNLIETICHHKEFSSKLKSALLNALFPLFKKEKFNLIDFVKNTLKKINILKLPNNPEILSLSIKEEAMYLEPELLDNINIVPMHSTHDTSIYGLEMKSISAENIASADKNDHLSLFIDQNILREKKPNQTLLNLHLLNEWSILQNKKSLSLSSLITKYFPSSSLKEGGNISSINTSKFEIDPNQDTFIGSAEVFEFFNSNEVFQEDFTDCIKDFASALCLNRPQYKKNELLFLADWIKQNQKPIFDNSLSPQSEFLTYFAYIICEIISRYSPSLSKINSQLSMMLEEMNTKEQMLYFLSLVHNLKVNKDNPTMDFLKETKPIYDKFTELSQVLETDAEYEIWLWLQFLSKMDLDHAIEFFQKISSDELKNKTFHLIPFLSEETLSQLKSINSKELNDLIPLLSEKLLKVSHPNKVFNHILQCIHPLKISIKTKKELIEIFYKMFDLIEKDFSFKTNFHFNTDCFFQVLKDVVQEDLVGEKNILKKVQEAYKVIDQAGNFFKMLKEFYMRTNSFCSQYGYPTKDTWKIWTGELEKYTSSLEIFSKKFIDCVKAYYLFFLDNNGEHIPSNKEKLAECYSNILEKEEYLTDLLRPLFYAALWENKNSHYEKFPFTFGPLENIAFAPLEADPDVVSHLKSEAKMMIRQAINQNLDDSFCFGEIIQNSIDANSKNIHIKLGFDEKQQLLMEIGDDGIGMGEEELIAFKTPHLSKKIKKTPEDPNYGWGGAFAPFKKFPALLLETSQGKGTTRTLYMEKDREDLKIQSPLPKEENTQNSFTRLLWKKNGNQHIEFIKIKSLLYATLKRIKGVNITFNGMLLNSSSSAKTPFIEYKIPYKLNSDLSIQIDNFTHGFFVKGIKKGEIPEEYLELIPEWIHKEMEKNGAKFSLFMPFAHQNMNRSGLLYDEEFVISIKKGFLMASLQYLLYNCRQGTGLDIFSEDYFNFTSSFIIEKSPFLKILQKNDSSEFENKKESDENTVKKLLLEKAEKYFTNLTKKRSLDFFGQNVFSLLKNLEQKQRNASSFDLLKKIKDKKSLILDVLLTMPLVPKGFSLINIRNIIYAYLIQEGLLNQFFQWNTQSIDTYDTKEFKIKIQNIFNSILNNIGKDESVYKNILSLFESKMLNVFLVIKQLNAINTSCSIQEEKILNCFTTFISDIGKYFFNNSTPVDIDFSHCKRAEDAYTSSKGIFFKFSGGSVQSFMNFFKKYPTISNKERFLAKFNKKLARILKVYTHELTHVDELSTCEKNNTHTREFYEKNAKKLQHLLVYSDQEMPSPFSIFKDVLNQYLYQEEAEISSIEEDATMTDVE